MSAVMKMMRLTVLLTLWTMWPTMAQELPKKWSNHVSNSNNDPVAHQEANIEANVSKLRKTKRSIDLTSLEENASGQELDSTSWSRFLFPFFIGDRNRNRNRNTPVSRKKTTRTRQKTMRTRQKTTRKNMKRRKDLNRKKFRIGKERVSSIRLKRERTQTTRKKVQAPIASPIASPVASPVASLVTSPESPVATPPTPAPPTSAPITPTMAPMTPAPQPVPTDAGAPSAPSSPVAR